MAMKNNIRIAVQKKGRLYEPSLEFLRSIGLKFKDNGRDLIVPCEGGDVELLFVRNGDIPEYVNAGVADFGIVGENVLIERKSNLKAVKKLGFGKCSVVLAVPEKSKIKSVVDLVGERIATSYPRTLKSFLSNNSVSASLIEIKGSTEITPFLNLSDAVCDITQTGNTLKDNDLKVIAKILDSEAVIVKCPVSSKIKWKEFEKMLTKEQ